MGTTMSFDKLQDRILTLKNPTVAGLDARLDYVPEHIRAEKIAQYGQTRKAAAEAIYTFNCGPGLGGDGDAGTHHPLRQGKGLLRHR